MKSDLDILTEAANLAEANRIAQETKMAQQDGKQNWYQPWSKYHNSAVVESNGACVILPPLRSTIVGRIEEIGDRR